MNSLRHVLPSFFLLGSAAFAQAPAPAPTPGSPAPAPSTAVPVAPTVAPSPTLRTDAELEQLLAPISLYPDALIALILPASVASTDIVLAARHLRDFPNDLSQVEHRAWDDSVKSLMHYPEVLKWMDENLPWVKQVGDAFVQQPADVMQAIQRLRARARAAGTLVDTPQQQVIAEPDVIRIVPAQPDVIYVPRYEPDVVFVQSPVYYSYTRPLLTFGLGVRAGSWLAYDCDWRRKTIWMGDRHRHWRGHDWRRPLVSVSHGFTHTHVTPGIRAWCPPPRTSFYHSRNFPHHHTTIIRPSPFGTPRHPSHHHVHSTRSHVRDTHVTAGPRPAHSETTSRRSFSPSRVAPSSATELRVTDPGTTITSTPLTEAATHGTRPHSSSPVTRTWNRTPGHHTATPSPSHSMPNVSRSWNREAGHPRSSTTRSVSQPVMGPQPPAGLHVPASSGIRLAPRSSSSAAHSAPAAASPAQPAVAPAAPAREVQQSAPARSPSPSPQRWTDRAGPRRGREDLQR